MWESLIAGIWIGMSINLLIGPIFFTMLDTTIENGKLAGLFLALGIFCSDTLLASAAYFSLRNIADNAAVQTFIGITGSIILMGFGFHLFTSKKIDTGFHPFSFKSYSKYWLRGFIINSFNPFTILTWITLATVKVFEPDNLTTRIGFYSGMIGSIFLGDIIKILISGKIRQMLTQKGILLIRNISGIAIFIFGVILLFRSLFL